jgi:hypothetical protein
MRILIFFDVEGWAWWHKAKNLKKFLPTNFNVEMLRMDQPYNHADYDFILFFDPYLINYATDVPPEKLIMGCSCPKFLEQLVELVSTARCAGGFVNNSFMYQEASYRLPNLFCCQNGVDESIFFPPGNPPAELIACWIGNTASVGQKGLDLIRSACDECGVPLLTLDREANRDQNDLLSQVQIRDSIYHRASLYICASEVEGTPNPALEALACGLPVITTKVGNMPEIIQDGYNGFLVERSVEAIAEAIEKLKKVDRAEMAHNARQSILQSWTWHKQTEKYGHMFRTLSKAGRQFMEVNLLNRAGTACLDKNDYAGACMAFKEVLSHDPHNRLAKYSKILVEKLLLLRHLS